MKNKFWNAHLLVLFVLMLLITGCSGQSSTEGQDSLEKENSGSLSVTIAGGAAGAAWSVVGEGIGSAIKKSYPDATFTYQPGQDGANVISVTQGKVPFAIATLTSAKLAYEGKSPFKSEIKDVRAVAYLHSMPYHFAVAERTGINSIEQIIEEKLPYTAAVNTERSIMEITSRVVLEAYGTSYEEIGKNGGKIEFIPPSKSTGLIKDKKMDGFMTPLPLPTGYVGELNTSEPMKLLPLSDKAIKKMEEELAATPSMIKAGTYDFVKEDIPTAAVSTILITDADVSDEQVYKLTKSIYEHLDYLHTVHQSFKQMTEETITNVQEIPLHEGAIKFYKEAGLMK